MLKFRATDNLEAYISDFGCLVLKQNSSIHGHEVTIVLHPEQAFDIGELISSSVDEMFNVWNGGLEAKDDSEA
jgi:hypothetical protein